MGKATSITKKAAAAALGAMAIAAAIYLIPWWPVRGLLLVGAIVFVVVMLRDRALFFMNSALMCFGAAAASGSIPTIKSRVDIAETGSGRFDVLNSPWPAIVLASVGGIAVVCELVHRLGWPERHSPARGPSALPGPVTNCNAPIKATTQQGPVNTGPVQHQTINYGAPAPSGSAPAKPTSPCNLPPRSPTFVPRQNITRMIHDALRGGTHTGALRQAAARAYGGCGKTVAAILYAHEYAEQYPGGRLFLSMERQDLTTALASLGRHLGVPADAKDEEAAAMVKAALEGAPNSVGTHPASLLILDNIIDAAQWNAILETKVYGTSDPLIPRGGCRVLITTRAESIPQAATVPVGRLTPEEAREVYRRFAKPEGAPASQHRDAPSDATADAITSLLGGLAVAVAAVAALLKLRTDLTWDGYATTLRDTPIIELPDASREVRAELGQGGTALDEHRRTLHVIDAALGSLPAPERRAVDYAALLPEDLVPAPWLVWMLEADAARPPAKHGGPPDPLQLEFPKKPGQPPMSAAAVVAHLDTLDVLTPKTEDGKILGLHRLWHSRVNERARDERRDRTPLLRAIAACAAARRATIIGTNPDGADRGVNNPAALTDQSLRWELTPLAETCKGLWAAGHSGPAAGVGVWLASVLQDLGRFAEAATCLPLSPQTDAAVEAAIGRKNLAIAYSNLAAIQQAQGDLPGARASTEKAIAIESKHFAPDHPTFATSYSNLATIQLDQGDLPGARASMEKAIAIAEKHLGAEHPNLATMRSNLATIQQAQGDLPGARASTEKAIAIKSKHFAPDHPTFATSYKNLAHICLAEGDRDAACANFKKALDVLLKHFGEDHPRVKITRASREAAGCTP
ncbi:MAG: tetratricopeptide repeat protein [Phycisphaerales bacterium]|nr:tetratricopeptide repeat protein [Phycisphaerales bacterium]